MGQSDKGSDLRDKGACVLRVIDWARWQRTKAVLCGVFIVIATLDGVFAQPTRELLAAAVLLTCVGLAAALAMSIALAFINKWAREGEPDPYWYV